MPAGYSGKPAYQKLGWKPEMAARIVGAPGDYLELIEAPEPESAPRLRARKNLDFAHVFTTSRAALERELPKLRDALRPAGMLWVSWPKRAAKIDTDVTEDVVRAVAFPLDLVDVKVCAVDAVWSGLKLVIRKERRSSTR